MSGAPAHLRLADEDPTVDERPRAAVTIARRPLWRIRLVRGLPRYVVCALGLAGALASVRFALDPPRAALPTALLRRPASEDLAAEGYATLFARAYLTWEAGRPEAREHALAPFVGPGMDGDAGLQTPGSGEQRVQWTQVVQERELQSGDHVYTVAAQTDTAGLLYLTVGVLRKPGGELALAGYPAFVGPPASGPAQSNADGRLREVSEPALTTVVDRALRNYLAGSPSELAADLSRRRACLAARRRVGAAVAAVPPVGARRGCCARARAGPGRPARRHVHARLRTRRPPRPGPLGDLGHPDGPRHLTKERSHAHPPHPSIARRPPAPACPLLGIALACALLGLTPIAARAAVASSSVPGAGAGQGGTGEGGSSEGSTLEAAASKAGSTGRKVAMSLIGLAFAVAGIVLAFRRDFKEAAGVFAVGIVAVLLATPAGINLLRDTVNSLFGS